MISGSISDWIDVRNKWAYTYVLSLTGNQTYHGDHLEIYRNIKSLWRVTGFNTVLQINYTSETDKPTNKLIEKEVRFVVIEIVKGGIQ